MRIMLTVVLLGMSTCAWPAPDERCVAVVEVTEGDQPIPALIRVLESDGTPVPLDGPLSRGFGLEEKHVARNWFVIPGRSHLRLPCRRIRIEAFRGIDTDIAHLDVDLAGKESAKIRVPLHRFYSAEAKGWRSANTHLHLQKISGEDASRYLGEIPPADRLDALFVSFLERAEADQDYISNRLSDADLRELSAKSVVILGNGEEHRHNFTAFGEGYGHVLFLNLKRLIRPVSLGPGIMKTGTDGIPLQRGMDEARKEGATVLWCHNSFGLEDIPNWLTGRPHAQNIFDGDPSTHGTYRDTFYRYLNVGLRVPFSTGTDWFIYDFSRVYARVGALQGPRDWLESLEQGRTYITNGPLLEFSVNDLGPGETLSLQSPSTVRVNARAVGRVDFRTLELLRNGEIVQAVPSRPEEGHFAADFSVDLNLSEPCWLAVRTPPPPLKNDPAAGFPMSELGGPIFSHTSAVYVRLNGSSVFLRSTAEGLLEDLKIAMSTIEKSGVFADEQERVHLLQVYFRAIAMLENRLK